MNIVEWEQARYERANELLNRRQLPPRGRAHGRFSSERSAAFGNLITVLDHELPLPGIFICLNCGAGKNDRSWMEAHQRECAA